MKIFNKSNGALQQSLAICFMVLSFCSLPGVAQAQPQVLECVMQMGDHSLEELLAKHSTELQLRRNNEFNYAGTPSGAFYCNPLTLDGVALNSNAITVDSAGELKLVKGERKNSRMIEIPFCLHLRRKAIILPRPGFEKILSKTEISAILRFAQEGDELIIEPANKEDWPAKRIIKIGFWAGC